MNEGPAGGWGGPLRAPLPNFLTVPGKSRRRSYLQTSKGQSGKLFPAPQLAALCFCKPIFLLKFTKTQTSSCVHIQISIPLHAGLGLGATLLQQQPPKFISPQSSPMGGGGCNAIKVKTPQPRQLKGLLTPDAHNGRTRELSRSIPLITEILGLLTAPPTRWRHQETLRLWVKASGESLISDLG